MEGHLSATNLLSGPPCGVLDLQGSLHSHHQPQNPHQNSVTHPQLEDMFPMPVGSGNECGQQLPMVDYKTSHWVSMGTDRGKTSTSDEEEPSLTEEGVDAHNESGKQKPNSQWHRVKWTDAMVKLLILIVSYIGEDAASECGGGKRKYAILQKKGKWKSVSKVMAEKGFDVSPQQCEDKFNDLNKRYKRLTDVLGRGTSCKVVENPSLLDYMDHLSEKKKEDVRKILSSKHLFYEEMCSYHNGNRLFLPSDPALQRSVQLALRSGEDRDRRRPHSRDDVDEDQREEHEIDDRDDDAEAINGLHDESDGFRGVDVLPKKVKTGPDVEDASFFSFPGPHDCGMQQLQDRSRTAWTQRQSVTSRALQLEEQKLSLQAQALELEKQRFKWQRFSMKKDRELDKLRMENERMKLENEHMALELKRRELANEYQ
ncbi:uncharacterized protein LOC116245968 [Nymphaea colorata]|uniref:uncharacterized protein LOC116245968 n=1 Tax=Nymphaea colorata TaxID=210225 RepID=UPI00129EC6B9|nr:uncharacterized protein LOC116245968 [Nymphaea colorata]XP_031473476.1 uncharacterized protein LOC116245968 [Nymphaea colorata]XP_031473477.1 uncharacterized protein LOC116245968 [Nymphaea colorata]XP_031473478.1 uncharacterized protein LOC116245968 [Nymphaea colorata]XP_031473479.1 uncharacterized protein LOC116245968 [Nymphaea colorata]XP_031473480.1 uncharacterized protein LOC116245968 [Nymphaea colorata]